MNFGSQPSKGNNRNSQEGTCGGDSGAPLIEIRYVDYDSGEIKYVLVAVLHGGIVSCDNSIYPSIYNRVATPKIHEWILEILIISF